MNILPTSSSKKLEAIENGGNCEVKIYTYGTNMTPSDFTLAFLTDVSSMVTNFDSDMNPSFSYLEATGSLSQFDKISFPIRSAGGEFSAGRLLVGSFTPASGVTLEAFKQNIDIYQTTVTTEYDFLSDWTEQEVIYNLHHDGGFGSEGGIVGP